LDVDTEPIGCCFDKESTSMAKDYRLKGLDSTSEAILDFLKGKGLNGLTSLEVGSGVGGLSIEMAKSGVSHARGLDLSKAMVGASRALARESGVDSSVSFELGDGARSVLEPADIVILDAVICCYPDAEGIIRNTSSAAKKYYAFAAPDDGRLLVRFFKVFLPLQRLRRRKGFRFYVHSLARVQRVLEERGFAEAFRQPSGRIWTVRVFATAGPP